MINHLNGKVAVITGGTRGIGLEAGLALGKLGVKSILTYRWGSDDQHELLARFKDANAPEPSFFCANVGDAQDTENLFQTLRNSIDSVDIFISNASQALRVSSLDEYSLKGLEQSIALSAFPFYEYTHKIKEVFGQYPRYVIGISSTGPDHYSINYDYVAASKVVLETLCKYMTYRLREEDVCLNIIRSRAIKTKSFQGTFGEDLEAFAKLFVPEHYWIQPEEVANVVVALCSGWMDSMRGQIINVDRGTTFFDNLMELYTRKEMISSHLQKKGDKNNG